MEVSVIIPVYNAAPFVEKAVRSALMQEEVKEVLAIDDGSTDGSLEILKKLAAEDGRVRMFRHSGGGNEGPGASRNVGLENARFEFVSFLDADDYFAEGRFRNTKKVFLEHPEADGIYGTAMVLSMTEKSQTNRKGKYIRMEHSSWNELFDDLFIGEKGHFSIITLVLRKSFINRAGFFDSELKQSEDTDFILRCALAGKLFPEAPSLVLAIINNHSNNVTNNSAVVYYYRWKLFEKWLPYFLKHHRAKRANAFFFRGFLDCHPLVRKFDGKKTFRKIIKGFVFLSYLLKSPRIAFFFL